MRYIVLSISDIAFVNHACCYLNVSAIDEDETLLAPRPYLKLRHCYTIVASLLAKKLSDITLLHSKPRHPCTTSNSLQVEAPSHVPRPHHMSKHPHTYPNVTLSRGTFTCTSASP
ncbi:hypothetical protein Fmac_020400 [Flemingia macrophylla]|uniref:Uncharacterized protein n=1 Tax=Flemingia macrophylla TaxID=520843 RepID=A0ABD1LUJ4_9FABA